HAGSVEEAVEAAAELGFPVVVKTASPGARKTKTGGVAVDLRDALAVRAAAERIGPPFLLQPFVQGRVELLAGVVQDPTFGPLVGFGVGGTLAELVGGAAYRVGPVSDVDSAELFTPRKVGRLGA